VVSSPNKQDEGSFVSFIFTDDSGMGEPDLMNGEPIESGNIIVRSPLLTAGSLAIRASHQSQPKPRHIDTPGLCLFSLSSVILRLLRVCLR
jgi:hypothetical protein